MGVLRKALFGAALFGAYKYIGPLFGGPNRRTYDGLSAVFATREQADVAVERLVQEYRIDRAAVFVEPIGERNSAGTAVSGGDHASGDSGARDRSDGPLRGAIKVTAPLGQISEGVLRQALRDIGASRIEAF
jgi:hypothetical protein